MIQLTQIFLLLSLAFASSKTFTLEQEIEYKSSSKLVNFINSVDFDSVIKNDIHFIFFGADWCPHCRIATPEWVDFDLKYGASLASFKIYLKKVECTKNEELCNIYAAKGFPELALFQNGVIYKTQDVEKYPADVTGFESFLMKNIPRLISDFKLTPSLPDTILNLKMSTLTQSANKTFGPNPKINQNGAAIHLTDDQFNDIAQQNNWFIMFHAPWCTHCVQLKPIFESIAPSLKNIVNVGMIDCTVEKNACKTNSVRGFPTLKFFQHGTFIADFSGERTAKNLIEFATKFVSYLYLI